MYEVGDMYEEKRGSVIERSNNIVLFPRFSVPVIIKNLFNRPTHYEVMLTQIQS